MFISSSESYMPGAGVQVGVGRPARGWIGSLRIVHLEKCPHRATLPGCGKARNRQSGFCCDDGCYLQIHAILSSPPARAAPHRNATGNERGACSPGLSLASLGTIYLVWFSLRSPQIVAFKTPGCPEGRCGKSWPDL